MKNLGVIFLLLFSLIKGTDAQALSPEAEISLLTSAPYEAEVFTVYGHAALRVSDPGQKIDVVFNYGMFSFDKPFFIYRFVKGETDYMLGVMPYAHYAVEYQMRGSTVTEQVLDLTPAERETIWKALVENARPENREYRYNFFFDNCSTRPAEIIEQNVEGGVDYSAWQPESLTFRDMINYCTRNKPWLTFGCDLVLGTPTDRTATPHEMLFLPGYLEEAFSKATIGEGGHARKLVKETRQYEAEPDEAEETVVTPGVVAWALFVLVAGITAWEIKKNVGNQKEEICLGDRRGAFHGGGIGRVFVVLPELYIGTSEHLPELEFDVAATAPSAFSPIFLHKKGRKGVLLLSFY